MTYDFILALDPSGSFHEGKGTTGWCILEEASQKITSTGNISALSYDYMEAYWQAHTTLLSQTNKKYQNRLIVVIENFLLYNHKAKAQVNSELETSKLLGVLQYYCWIHKIPYAMQNASEVKNRWNDKILHYKQYLTKHKNKLVVPHNKEKIDRHCKDAIRHAVHYSTFRNKESDMIGTL